MNNYFENIFFIKGINKIINIAKNQYHSIPKTNFLKAGHTVTKNSVKNNMLNFSKEKSYHFIFLPTLFANLIKFMFTPLKNYYLCFCFILIYNYIFSFVLVNIGANATDFNNPLLYVFVVVVTEYI